MGNVAEPIISLLKASTSRRSLISKSLFPSLVPAAFTCIRSSQDLGEGVNYFWNGHRQGEFSFRFLAELWVCLCCLAHSGALNNAGITHC